MGLVAVMVDRRRSGDVLDVFTVGHVGITCVLHEAVHSLHVVNQDKNRARKYEEHRNDAEDSDAVKANEDIYRIILVRLLARIGSDTHMRVGQA